MSDGTLNLCDEILSEARKLQLKDSGILSIQQNSMFIDAYDKHINFQRTILTTLLFKILMSASFQPPAPIRMALNSANDNLSWLDDVKITIIPFIVANQDSYFPDLH